MLKSRLLAFVLKELREVLPPMVFFAISFNLIVLTTIRRAIRLRPPLIKINDVVMGCVRLRRYCGAQGDVNTRHSENKCHSYNGHKKFYLAF